MGDEQDRAGEGAQRVLERLAALHVEMIGGLIEDQHVGARAHEDRQREAAALSAGEALQRLLRVLAGEQEAAQQRARLARGQAGRALRDLEHPLSRRAARAQLLAVLGEVADVHAVAGAERSRRERPPAGERLDQGRLPGPVGPHERDVLAALEPQLGVIEQHAGGRVASRDGSGAVARGLPAAADLDAAVAQLEDHARGAGRRRERELESLGGGGIALDALELGELLHPRLRLARLGGLVAEALDEPFHARDLRALRGDRAAEGELAGGALLAPLVPAAGEVARSGALELEHRGADHLEEPAIVRHHDDSRVESQQRLLEPLQRGDVEMIGRLVEQQHVGAGGQRAREGGARELAPGEGGEGAIEVLLAEPQAARRRARALAPQIAAARLQSRLRPRVARQQRLVGAARRHPRLQLRQLRLDGELLRASRQQVLAQRQAALARGALVVQRDAHPLGHAQLAAVDRALARQHAQEGRLAHPVAPRERHPLAALELEGDAPQQRASADVLVQLRCGQQRHEQ